jgi:hypothetical protein
MAYPFAMGGGGCENEGATGLLVAGGGASPWCCTRYCSRRSCSASLLKTALVMTGEVKLAHGQKEAEAARSGETYG